MPVHYEDDKVTITKVVVGPMVNNVFVARCLETGDSVLIDAADEPEVLLSLCEELNVGSLESLTDAGGDLVDHSAKGNFRALGKRFASRWVRRLHPEPHY